MRGEEPPTPPCASDWAERTRRWQVRIKLDRAVLPVPAVSDPFFWYVGIHDECTGCGHRTAISYNSCRAQSPSVSLWPFLKTRLR
jgi:hypothetical protein